MTKNVGEREMILNREDAQNVLNNVSVVVEDPEVNFNDRSYKVVKSGDYTYLVFTTNFQYDASGAIHFNQKISERFYTAIDSISHKDVELVIQVNKEFEEDLSFINL